VAVLDHAIAKSVLVDRRRTTERLVLRAPQPSDAEAIVALLNERRIAENTVRIPHPYSLADAQAFIASANTNEGETVFVITRKSVGVILPAQKLTFDTAAPEKMELVAGRCRVKLPGANAAREFAAGQSFDVPGQSSFEIEALEPLHYVCHFG